MLKAVPRLPVADAQFEKPETMPDLIYRLLVARGFSSVAEAARFLRPALDDLTDPLAMHGMQAAVTSIRAVQASGGRVCVFGDYDVDGVCASAIAYLTLHGIGVDAEVYLPRRGKEGYGLNKAAIDTIAESFALLLTVDCGITAAEEVAYAQEKGLRVVVTDHHRLGEVLPDAPTVDPLLDGPDAAPLCGAGVAWKLSWALAGRETAMTLIDLAALATVADIVPLIGENRVIVQTGLTRINAAPRPGMAALIHAAGLTGRTLTADSLAFQLAPRINAGGRMSDAMHAYALLVETDPVRCQEMAEALNGENEQRRALEQQTLAEAEAQLESFSFPAHRILILCGETWNPGIIGLTAARLVQKYHYPVILLAADDDTLTGSCRSIPGVDIHAALVHVQDLFLRFGGHKQAAGLTMARKNLPELIRRLDEYLMREIPPQAYVPTVEYDLCASLADFTPEAVAALELFAPTGCRNPAPVFLVNGRAENVRAIGQDGKHLKFMLAEDAQRMDAIAFQMGARAAEAAGWTHFIVRPSINRYRNTESVQVELRAVADPSPSEMISSIQDADGARIQTFLTEVLYNKEHTDKVDECFDITTEALESMLRGRAQGTLIVAIQPQSVQALMPCLDDLPVEIRNGTWPDDPMKYNALCFCPSGPMPAGYERIVALDMPPALFSAKYHLALAARENFLAALPDVDAMRKLYLAFREMTKMPMRFQTRSKLAQELAAMADLPPIAAAAGLAVLADMKLIEFSNNPNGPIARMLPPQKGSPEENAVYRRMQEIRRQST